MHNKSHFFKHKVTKTRRNSDEAEKNYIDKNESTIIMTRPLVGDNYVVIPKPS